MSPEEVHRLTFQSLVNDESCIKNNNNNSNKNEAPQQRPHSLTKDDINPSLPDIDNVSSENK